MPHPVENDEVGAKIEIREWELNDNSTVYDRLMAAPADETMEVQWIIYITIMAISLSLMTFVFLGMIRDEKCRRNSFNTYVLFLLASDLFFSGCCMITCNLSLHKLRYHSANGCAFQSIYCMFTVTSSAWINAIVIRQLHQMLICSRNAVRYHPPARKEVVKQCLGVYVYSMFLASWSNWGVDWWPIRNNIYSGVMCLPMPYDLGSTLFFYLFYAPLIFAIPFVYIIYVVSSIIRNKLLPEKEKRKTLMVFFRLLVVYFVMWVPAVLLIFVGGNWLSTWYVVFGGSWAHLQGAVSAGICLFKPDIRKACFQMLPCFCGWETEPLNDAEKPSSSSGFTANISRQLKRQNSQDFLGFQEETFKSLENLELEEDCAGELSSLEEGRNGTSDAKGKKRDSSTLKPSAYEIAMGMEAGELRSIPSETGSVAQGDESSEIIENPSDDISTK